MNVATQGRPISERAAACQQYMADTKAVYNDAGLIRGAIEREFADVVTTDPQVLALVAAAKYLYSQASYALTQGDIPVHARTPMQKAIEETQAALKPFGE